MNQTCIIASKSEKLNFDSGKEKVLYIEDYAQFSSVVEARKLTDKIFSHNADFIAEHDYKGYEITWSWYSDVFQFCIKYLEIEKLIQTIDALDAQHLKISNISSQYRKVLEVYFFNKKITSNVSKSELLSNTKQILFNVVILLFSMISILFFLLRSGKNIGTYTGDFVYKNTKSDFRLNHLYERYQENNIQYVEFIRVTKVKFTIQQLYFLLIYLQRRLNTVNNQKIFINLYCIVIMVRILFSKKAL